MIANEYAKFKGLDGFLGCKMGNAWYIRLNKTSPEDVCLTLLTALLWALEGRNMQEW